MSLITKYLPQQLLRLRFILPAVFLLIYLILSLSDEYGHPIGRLLGEQKCGGVWGCLFSPEGSIIFFMILPGGFAISPVINPLLNWLPPSDLRRYINENYYLLAIGVDILLLFIAGFFIEKIFKRDK